MPRPRTATEALAQCEAVWTELARTGSDSKREALNVVLDYEPRLDCPACEWAIIVAKNSCSGCPVDAWRLLPGVPHNGCCSYNSPYEAWSGAASAVERQAAAREILALVRSSAAYSPR